MTIRFCWARIKKLRRAYGGNFIRRRRSWKRGSERKLEIECLFAFPDISWHSSRAFQAVIMKLPSVPAGKSTGRTNGAEFMARPFQISFLVVPYSVCMLPARLRSPQKDRMASRSIVLMVMNSTPNPRPGKTYRTTAFARKKRFGNSTPTLPGFPTAIGSLVERNIPSRPISRTFPATRRPAPMKPALGLSGIMYLGNRRRCVDFSTSPAEWFDCMAFVTRTHYSSGS